MAEIFLCVSKVTVKTNIMASHFFPSWKHHLIYTRWRSGGEGWQAFRYHIHSVIYRSGLLLWK